MKRRNVLAAAGVGILGTLAGCTGGTGDRPDDGSTGATPTATPTETDGGGAPFEHAGTLDADFATSGDFPADEDPADGRPPAFEEPPAAPDVDPSTFETLPVNGETVRLAPVDVVADWYRRGEARMVDARGLDQYRRAHVYGAVFSRAQRESDGGPIPEWPIDERVVTYCNCPHHLSSLRAAGLQKAGYSTVYALDEGFARGDRSWAGQRHPMAGTEFRTGSQAAVTEWTVSGEVDARYAGEYALAAAGRQYEAAPIRADGGYDLHLRFAGVDPKTPVEISTPAGTETVPLGEVGTRH